MNCLELAQEDSETEEILKRFSDIFLKEKTAFLSDQAIIFHYIQLVNEAQLSYELLYNLLTNKLEVLRKYLKNMQQ